MFFDASYKHLSPSKDSCCSNVEDEEIKQLILLIYHILLTLNPLSKNIEDV